MLTYVILTNLLGVIITSTFFILAIKREDKSEALDVFPWIFISGFLGFAMFPLIALLLVCAGICELPKLLINCLIERRKKKKK